jgi:hypothetical protein
MPMTLPRPREPDTVIVILVPLLTVVRTSVLRRHAIILID